MFYILVKLNYHEISSQYMTVRNAVVCQQRYSIVAFALFCSYVLKVFVSWQYLKNIFALPAAMLFLHSIKNTDICVCLKYIATHYFRTLLYMTFPPHKFANQTYCV